MAALSPEKFKIIGYKEEEANRIYHFLLAGRMEKTAEKSRCRGFYDRIGPFDHHGNCRSFDPRV